MIKEDGSGQNAENIISLDQDDDGILYINSKGRTQTFEVDKVFGEKCTQDQVHSVNQFTLFFCQLSSAVTSFFCWKFIFGCI